MANYIFTKYWVEGTKEGIHQLYDAIAKADGWAHNAIEALGLNGDEYEENFEDYGGTEWHEPSVKDKEGYSILFFEEQSPWERSNIIDYLICEDGSFANKLTNLYYYASDGDGWGETNDGKNKYWANRIAITLFPIDEFEEPMQFYGKNEDEVLQQLHKKYQVLSEFDNLVAIKEFVDGDNMEEYNYFDITKIDVID